MSNTMTTQRLLLTWALGATLIAVGALGYIVGKQAGERAPAATTAAVQSTTDPAATALPARPQYVIPEAFAAIPTQWHSTVDASAEGHAALFDPKRQRLIVEHCRHHSYASVAAVNAAQDFCTPLASGRLISLETSEATLVDRNGQDISVSLELDGSADTPTLTIGLDDLTIAMQPGSRNDLMQAMEALPDVQDNKHAYLVAMMAPSAERTPSERAEHNK